MGYIYYYICGIPFAISIYMKKLYVVFFFLFISLGYAQDAKPNGDIMGFKLYPNPVTNGKVYIVTKEKAPKKILIFDVLGTQVMETTLLREELNVSELDAGVYVLRVFEKNKIATRKLIIK
tara:strand:+ start:731 stop:1093 length:363 start_codon:yes stop_codon:yes gene_type:complete